MYIEQQKRVMGKKVKGMGEKEMLKSDTLSDNNLTIKNKSAFSIFFFTDI